MKMKLSTLSKKLSSKRWRSKQATGPLTVTSISLAGSCFREELDHDPKSSGQLELHLNSGITRAQLLGNSLTNSMASVYSSELEMGQMSSSSSQQSSSASSSRSSSMLTSSSESSHLTPSWSDVYLPYLDEDDDLQLEQIDERTLFMGKNAQASKRPIALRA